MTVTSKQEGGHYGQGNMMDMGGRPDEESGKEKRDLSKVNHALHIQTHRQRQIQAYTVSFLYINEPTGLLPLRRRRHFPRRTTPTPRPQKPVQSTHRGSACVWTATKTKEIGPAGLAPKGARLHVMCVSYTYMDARFVRWTADR